MGVPVEKLFQVCGVICARIFVDHLLYEMEHQLPVTLCHSLMKQILGLPVSCADFQYDDPEMFDSRVKYINENDPSELDIFFMDQIYNHKGELHAEVPLMPNGQTVRVSEANKVQYLKRLAQYRLRETSEKNIQSFIQGMFGCCNQIILKQQQDLEQSSQMRLLVCLIPLS